MVRRNLCGGILIEILIALLLLSIGVTSVIGVFSEALFAGTRNREILEARAGLDHLLFRAFAHPGGVLLPEDGAVTLTLMSDEIESPYVCQILSKNLSSEPSLHSAQYYDAHYLIQTIGNQNVMDLRTVVRRTGALQS